VMANERNLIMWHLLWSLISIMLKKDLCYSIQELAVLSLFCMRQTNCFLTSCLGKYRGSARNGKFGHLSLSIPRAKDRVQLQKITYQAIIANLRGVILRPGEELRFLKVERKDASIFLSLNGKGKKFDLDLEKKKESGLAKPVKITFKKCILEYDAKKNQKDQKKSKSQKIKSNFKKLLIRQLSQIQEESSSILEKS